MIKTIFTKRSFIYLSVTGIIFGFIIACMHLMPESGIALEDAFLYARENRVKPEYGEFSFNPFTGFFNIVVFLAMVTQFSVNDYDVAKSYIFTRVKSVSNWYGYKLLQIFIYCLYSQIIYNLSLLLTAYAMGFRAGNIHNVIWYLVFGIIAGFLVLLSVSVMCCVVALKIKPHISTAVFMFIVVIGIVAMYCVMGNSFLYGLNAVVHYFTTLHIENLPAYMNFSYPSWVYYLGLFLFSGVEALIGSRILKKSDMI